MPENIVYTLNWEQFKIILVFIYVGFGIGLIPVIYDWVKSE